MWTQCVASLFSHLFRGCGDLACSSVWGAMPVPLQRPLSLVPHAMGSPVLHVGRGLLAVVCSARPVMLYPCVVHSTAQHSTAHCTTLQYTTLLYTTRVTFLYSPFSDRFMP